MRFKDKIIIAFLTLMTLGVYPLMMWRGKRRPGFNAELSTLDKVSIDIKKIIESVGGHKNIVGTEYTHTKVKIFFDNKEEVDVKSIRELNGVSGVFVSSNYITIIVGKQAKSLAAKL